MQFQFSDSQPTTAPIKALVLDDDAIDRKLIRRFTERSDLDVTIEEAPTLSVMADLMGESSFDVIMVDYNLSEGDGLDALNMIQNNKNNKNAAVIMISGQDQTALAVSAFRQGCSDFLNKNELSTEALKHAMTTVMARKDTRRYFNPFGSKDFQNAVEHAVLKALESASVQDAIAAGFKAAANQSVGIGFDHQNVEQVQHFVADFLEEPDFHFNTYTRNPS